MTDRVPHSSGTDAPAFPLPSDACDCHMHIFDPTLPFARNAVLTHGAATPAQYDQLRARLGLRRNVIVQPSSYGGDHRALLAALKHFGASARGVAVITPETADEELNQLAAAGVVGARLNLVQRGATDIAMAKPLAARLRHLGWHLEVHMLPVDFLQAVDQLVGLGVDIVVDHFARACTEPALAPLITRAVNKLLDSGHGWLKLSGAYMAVPHGSGDLRGPALQQLDDFVTSLADRFSSRLVWGTDWPHATESVKPDDAALADLLARWFPPPVRDAILVTNPAVLYRFNGRDDQRALVSGGVT
ncbi:putative TIM-barrel fold metal-dependent hydrolase [Cupriavidus plantarum]|nr:putative TIM-barrel fold metal-dependent hydrolase [Cupriavidus plantarum]